MGRHPTPRPAPPDGQPRTEPAPTGIDYLGIIAAEHDQAARRHRIRYDALADGEQPPGGGGQEDGQ